MGLFQNASPEQIWLGAHDNAGRPLPYQRDPIPQHVPLIYTFAEKGTLNKVFVSGAKAVSQFGAQTFNQDGQYYTHTTEMALAMFGAGNACAVKRVVPSDAGAPANTVIYVDVLPTTVPVYQRDPVTGAIMYDPATNAPLVVVGSVPVAGVNIKYITEPATGALGSAVSKPGTMSTGAGATLVTSTMHPLFELRAAAEGLFYNNLGIATQSILAAKLNTASVTANKALEYNLSIMLRNAVGTSTPVTSLFGENAVKFSLNPLAKDPATGNKIDIKTIFETQWYNETDPLKSIRYNEFQGFHIYQAQLDAVLTAIMTNEKTHVTTATLANYDFTTTDPLLLNGETYLIDIFSGKTSKGMEYATVVMDNTTPTLVAGQTEVHMSANTPVYMAGGSDGTLSTAMFEAAVSAELAQYLDPNSQVMDNAVNVETHLYDSGFTLPVKKELLNLIALRKDTAVCLGTHVYVKGAAVDTLSATRATALVLKTQALLFPESDFYGTPTARAVVIAGGAKLNSSLSNDFYPAVFDIAIKTAQLAGAGNYKWNAARNFDHGQAAILSSGYEYQPSFIPAGIKPLLWNNGMVWAQPRDRSTYFWPAVQTVYGDDTSPLNNWLTVCALATLNRIASDAWRQFTGTSTMSDLEFRDAVLAYLQGRLNGIFDGLVVVNPDVIITADDALRGYSWHVVFKLFSGTMKTKMVSYSEVYRLNALGTV